MLVVQISKDPDHETVILTLGAGEHSGFHDWNWKPLYSISPLIKEIILHKMDEKENMITKKGISMGNSGFLFMRFDFGIFFSGDITSVGHKLLIELQQRFL